MRIIQEKSLHRVSELDNETVLLAESRDMAFTW